MKTVAPHDRPREKLERLGPSALGDNELLAIVLGQGSRRRAVLDLANAVLSACGGLHGLVRARHDARPRRAGHRRARAAQILAAIEIGRRTLTRLGRERVQFSSPRDAAEFLLPQYGGRPVEQFGVVLLDTKLRVLRASVLSIGTATPVSSIRGMCFGRRRSAGPVPSCCSTTTRQETRDRAATTCS
jgi:DNA repair protein RadC